MSLLSCVEVEESFRILVFIISRVKSSVLNLCGLSYIVYIKITISGKILASCDSLMPLSFVDAMQLQAAVFLGKYFNIIIYHYKDCVATTICYVDLICGTILTLNF